MNILKLMEIENCRLVSIVGGGGKTSLMKRMSHELFRSGKNVLITTTTAIYVPEEDWAHRIVLASEERYLSFIETGGITALGSRIDENHKLRGVEPELLCRIKAMGLFDMIIAESDGSKGLPVKAPAGHEPVISSCSDMVIGVIGIECIGRKIDRMTVHRMDEFCLVTGKTEGDIIDCSDIARLIMSPFGIFKGAGKAKKNVFLNKVEGAEHEAAAGQIIDMVRLIHEKSKDCKGDIQIDGIFAASLKEGRVDKIWKRASKLQG